MAAKLLLADDSITIQKVVELTLADQDYDITMVSDGASALRKAEEILPDLILADIVMPELNGYELCEKIRQHPALSHTPVLLLSSTFETYDEERGRKVGANDHIVKPFESDVLIEKVRKGIEEKAAAPAATAPPAAPAEVPETRPAEAPAAPAPASDFMSPERVEEEEFDFELTDAFLEEAEEMFEAPDDQAAGEQGPAEEFLPQEPEKGLPASAETPAETPAFAEEDFGELPPLEETIPETPPDFADLEETVSETETPGASFEEPAPFTSAPEPSPEIDRELLEEEPVSVYEIPEEYAEGPDLKLSEVGAESAESPFVIQESAPADLIDDFMAPAPETPAAEEPQTEISEEEIQSAVEPGPPPSIQEPAAVETPEPSEDLEEAFSLESAVDSEWSPELASYGGNPEAVSDDVVEKPFPQTVAAPTAAPVTEETVRRIVAELVEQKASEIIERVAWEVIPDLAEVLIQKEIRRLQQEVEHP